MSQCRYANAHGFSGGHPLSMAVNKCTMLSQRANTSMQKLSHVAALVVFDVIG